MANLIQGIGVAKPVSQTIASALGIGGLLESQRRTGLLERREASAEQDAAQLRQMRAMQIKQMEWEAEPINPRNTTAWLNLTDLERKKLEPWLNKTVPPGKLIPRNQFYQEINSFLKSDNFQRHAQELSAEASDAVMKANKAYQENPTPANKKKLDQAMQTAAIVDKRWNDLSQMINPPEAKHEQWGDLITDSKGNVIQKSNRGKVRVVFRSDEVDPFLAKGLQLISFEEKLTMTTEQLRERAMENARILRESSEKGKIKPSEPIDYEYDAASGTLKKVGK